MHHRSSEDTQGKTTSKEAARQPARGPGRQTSLQVNSDGYGLINRPECLQVFSRGFLQGEKTRRKRADEPALGLDSDTWELLQSRAACRVQSQDPDRAGLGLSIAHISPAFIDQALNGTFCRVKIPNRQVIEHKRGDRGAISDFSRQSAKRLYDTVMSLDREQAGKPIFVTLTYPRQYSADPKDWKRDLDAFCKWVQRVYPCLGLLWKLEPQDRGAPHFHLLIFGGSGYFIPHRQVAIKWNQIAGRGDRDHRLAGTRVESIRSWNGVMSYASKNYMGKSGMRIPDWWRRPGRFWGVRGNLPIRYSRTVMSDRAANIAKRTMRRFMQARYRNAGRDKRKIRASYRTFYLSDKVSIRIVDYAKKHARETSLPEDQGEELLL